jgi:hypothetical protein
MPNGRGSSRIDSARSAKRDNLISDKRKTKKARRRRKKKKQEEQHMSRKFRITMKRGTREKIVTAMSIFSSISDVVFILRSLRNKPTTTDLVAAGIKTGGILLNYVEFVEESSHFDKFWGDYYESRLPLFNLNDYNCEKVMLRLLNDHYAPDVIYESDNNEPTGDSGVSSGIQLLRAFVDDIELFWCEKNGNLSHGPFVEEGREEEVMEILGKKLWDNIDSKHVAFRMTESGSFDVVNDRLANDTLPSKIAEECADRIRKYNEHDIVRAIFFYGRAGTGKSTCMREIARILEMRTLRIDGDQIDSYDSLEPLITMLRPGCILIDDADRHLNGRDLTTLEELRKNTKVIMASANYPQNVDAALLRPGRFDEAIHIDRLDDAVIAKMVGDEVPDKFRDILATMPIAYLNEFNIRKRVLGVDGAIANIADLVQRCERMEIPSLGEIKMSDEVKKLVSIASKKTDLEKNNEPDED